MNLNFGGNKTSVEVIKEGAFGGTYFSILYLKNLKSSVIC